MTNPIANLLPAAKATPGTARHGGIGAASTATAAGHAGTRDFRQALHAASLGPEDATDPGMAPATAAAAADPTDGADHARPEDNGVMADTGTAAAAAAAVPLPAPERVTPAQDLAALMAGFAAAPQGETGAGVPAGQAPDGVDRPDAAAAPGAAGRRFGAVALEDAGGFAAGVASAAPGRSANPSPAGLPGPGPAGWGAAAEPAADAADAAAQPARDARGALPAQAAQAARGPLPAQAAQAARGALPAQAAQAARGALPAQAAQAARGALPAQAAQAARGTLPAQAAQAAQAGVSRPEAVGDTADGVTHLLRAAQAGAVAAVARAPAAAPDTMPRPVRTAAVGRTPAPGERGGAPTASAGVARETGPAGPAATASTVVAQGAGTPDSAPTERRPVQGAEAARAAAEGAQPSAALSGAAQEPAQASPPAQPVAAAASAPARAGGPGAGRAGHEPSARVAVEHGPRALAGAGAVSGHGRDGGTERAGTGADRPAPAAGMPADPQPAAATPLPSGLPTAAAQPGASTTTAAAAPAATPAAPFQAQLAAALASPGFAPALGTQLRMLMREGIGQARLELNPVEMGPVSVSIELDGRSAHVEFGADLAATRAALQDSLPTLAAALRDSGFTLSGGGVSERQAGHGGGNGNGNGGNAPGGRPGGSPAGAGGTHDGAATAPAAPTPAAGAARGVVDLYA